MKFTAIWNNLLQSPALRTSNLRLPPPACNKESMISDEHPTFRRLGPAEPAAPVIFSVPHAGRRYPANFGDYTRYTPAQLLPLEDRFADLMVLRAEQLGHTILIAETPRVWIDLNRDESDFDPEMLHPPQRARRPLSARVRGGLGLIPRRTATLGEIWRKPLSEAALSHRIQTAHWPYHRALSAAIAQTYQRFGIAILIDVHSMPPVAHSAHSEAPQVVIGDRFGRSAHGRFSARLASIVEAHGLRTGFNVPYAGGHILDRHGAPARGVHALQLEVDRRLYLDTNMCEPGQGLAAVQDMLAAIATGMSDEASFSDMPLAAE